MTFDPFGDFESKGYLRNVARAKDKKIVKQIEHAAFTTALDSVFQTLAKRETITYDDVLSTHGDLFDAVYPWAGKDRLALVPDLAISKGEGTQRVRFANPQDIRRSIEWALTAGQDTKQMAASPGTVMGYLAFGHPFLDGNGRTIMVIHCELAHRAGISIDWASTDKNAYLTALTREIGDPDKGHLDAYLKPFVRKAIGKSGLAGNVAGAPGLDGEGEDQILGSTADAKLKAEYEVEKVKRKDALG